jgi:GST-like protein
MDKQLGLGRFLAGDEYTIADIATFPWTLNAAKRGVNLPDYPNVSRWHQEIAARPAVVRGMALLAEERKSLDQKPTDAERDVMFGAMQYQQR